MLRSIEFLFFLFSFMLTSYLLIEYFVILELENLQINGRAHSMHWQHDPAFTMDLNRDKKFVLLVASFRSGSTFVGQLFDQNPRVQYLFEPFHEKTLSELEKRGAIVGARPDHTISDLRMLYLQQVMSNCSVYPTSVIQERYEYCGTKEEHMHRY